MAPESLRDHLFTTQSDVWSFGILLWEITTLGATPYPGLTMHQVLQAVTEEGQRPARPAHCRPELYRIMQACWAGQPPHRPSFGQLARELGHILAENQLYLDLNQFAREPAKYVYCYPVLQPVPETVDELP